MKKPADDLRVQDHDDDATRPVAAVQRAMLVLDAFQHATGTLALAEISTLTGLYKSTTARLLRTLEQQDYVVRTANGDFHVGPALLQLANRYQQAVQPEETVIPILQALVEQTLESASYVVPLGDEKIMLYRVHSSHALRDHGLPGDVVPLDRGAAGHVLRAYRDGHSRDSAVRERLVAVSTGEIESGMLGMASPVFDRAGDCVGSVALTGPAQRFTDESIRLWEPPLLRAAQAMTVQLGGNGRLFDAVLAGRSA